MMKGTKQKIGYQWALMIGLLIGICIFKKHLVCYAQEFSDALTIRVNTYVSGTISEGSDYEQDYYKFSVTKDGYVVLNFKNPQQDTSDSYWNMELYDAQYNSLVYTEIKGNTSSTDSTAIGIAAGIYYVKISSASRRDACSEDTYSFCVEYSESDYWEKEQNESYSTATEMVTGKMYNGTISKGYDYEKDYYVFTTSNNGSINVTFTNPLQNDSSEYWKVELYNSSYEKLCSWDITGNVKTTQLPIIGVGKGTFYILITSHGRRDASSTDMYGVTVSFEKSEYWEREFNEEYTSATAMNLNQDYSGVTWAGYYYEKDYYQFSISRQGIYKVVMSVPKLDSSEEYWKLQMFDSSYQKLKEQYVYGNKETYTIAGTFSAGDYYICVQSSSYSTAKSTDKYTLKVSSGNEDDVKNSCNHEYSITKREPTYFNKGWYIYTCKKCGYTYKKSYAKKLKLKQVILCYEPYIKNRTMHLMWYVQNDATGYEIKYYDRKGKKNPKVIKRKGVTANIKKLDKRKTYVVKVRSYIKQGTKTAYGKWSKKCVVR